MVAALVEPTSQALTTLLHLEQRALVASTAANLGFTVANETLALVAYRQAAVFNIAANGKAEVMTASGLVSVSDDSPFVVWLNRFAQTFPSDGECHRLSFADAAPEFGEGWQEWLPDQLLVASLRGVDGVVAGMVMYAREGPWHDGEVLLLDRLHLTFGYCLGALNLRKRGVAWAVASLPRGRARWALLGLVAALFIPVRLSALAPAEVVALNAMAVAAPQEGVIAAVFVQPNAPVKTGDVLFSMVDTTLSSRREVALKALSIASAEALAAQQRAFDDLKSKGDLAAATGRVNEKEAELAAVDALLGRIVVKAERDGIAIFSDANDWLGRPVQTGERVMQVANPNDTGVLIWLSAADALNLEAGAPVRLFLHTDPLSPLGAELYQTSYQAVQSPDGVAAYRLFGRFDKTASPQRIGLRGTARVSGDWALLGYYLLRRPIAAVREWSGV